MPSVRVVICPVSDIGQGTVCVAACLEVDPLFLPITMEELLEGLVDLRVAFGWRVASLRKEVAILMRLVGSLPVAWHTRYIA
jgi:hypothetical protein